MHRARKFIGLFLLAVLLLPQIAHAHSLTHEHHNDDNNHCELCVYTVQDFQSVYQENTGIAVFQVDQIPLPRKQSINHYIEPFTVYSGYLPLFNKPPPEL